jgi:methanethiol S-methyltransferase
VTLLALLLILWCALHSALVSSPIIRGLRRRLGSGYRFYRLFFNAFSVLTLLPVLAYQHRLATGLEPTQRWQGPPLAVRLVLLGSATALFIAGGRRHDLLAFLGFRQLQAQPTGPPRLASGGVLEITRHPWYLGAMALIWAGRLDPPGLVANLVLTVYLVVGTLLEERKLVDEFGDDYRAYQRRVSMLIPFKWLAARLRSCCSDPRRSTDPA